jgi:alkylhydroperoxidase family enzyme
LSNKEKEAANLIASQVNRCLYCQSALIRERRLLALAFGEKRYAVQVAFSPQQCDCVFRFFASGGQGFLKWFLIYGV